MSTEDTEPNPTGRPGTCPDCGQPLPADSPGKLCPTCLLRQAIGTGTGAGATRTVLADDPAPDRQPPPPPPSPEELADRFPGFKITECLGRGGMGVVYKARQVSLDRTVAIKVLAPERVGDPRFSERFAAEAQTLGKLHHPNIVTVFDYGETGGLYYIVMEYVDGVNLRDLLRAGKLEPQQALAVVPPVCEALQFAHDKGIVHRDIKPENLLLDRDGRIKIADFGIASLIGAAGDPAGTPPYMAPEQGGSGSATDHRADIYALGVVLYETLTGERPHSPFEPPSQKVQLDIRIDDIVLRAISREPERRYRSASEFRTVVETVTAPSRPAAPGTPPPPPPTAAAPAPGPTPAAVSAGGFPPAVPAATAATGPGPAGSVPALDDPRWVKAAGIAMAAVGVLNVVSPLLAVVVLLVSRVLGFYPSPAVDFLARHLPFGRFDMGVPEVLFVTVMSALPVAVGLVAGAGGIQLLRGGSRAWAIAGAVACCLSPTLWVLGIIVGVGSLVLLLGGARGGAAAAASGPSGFPGVERPRWSGWAIAGGVLHGISLALLALLAVGIANRGHEGFGVQVLPIALLLLLLAVPGSILGWVGASRVRRSEGRLRGRRLAILSGMVLPVFLCVPLVASGAILLDVKSRSLPGHDRPTELIFGLAMTATCVTLAVAGLRTCFRHLRGRPVNVFSKPVWVVGGVFALLWLGVGALLWVQRPVAVGELVTRECPEAPYSVSGSTSHRMRVFGGDQLAYKFSVVGLNGTVGGAWEIPVPYARLATAPESTGPVGEFRFDRQGGIDWERSGDDQVATFSLRGIPVFAITVEPDGDVSGRER